MKRPEIAGAVRLERDEEPAKDLRPGRGDRVGERAPAEGRRRRLMLRREPGRATAARCERGARRGLKGGLKGGLKARLRRAVQRLRSAEALLRLRRAERLL